jgi:hypothetical protein
VPIVGGGKDDGFSDLGRLRFGGFALVDVLPNEWAHLLGALQPGACKSPRSASNALRRRQMVKDDRISALKSAAMSIALDVQQQMLTHAQYLDLRDQRLFKHVAWSKVPGYVRNEIIAFLRGAIFVIERNHTEWYHQIDGKLVPRYTPGIDHRVVDSNLSAFRWKADPSRVWM